MSDECNRPQESSGVYQDALSRCQFLLGGDGYFRCPALVASGERFCDQHKGVEKDAISREAALALIEARRN